MKRLALLMWMLVSISFFAGARAAKMYLPLSSITQIDMGVAKCEDVSDTLAKCKDVMVAHLPKLSASPVKEDGRQVPLK